LVDRSISRTLAYLADPIIIEFVFGVAIGFAYREINGPAKIISATLLAIGAAGFVSTAVFDLSFLSRVIIWGIPSACLVSGAILIGEASTNHFWRAATFLGDISYSLYLTHGISMGAMKVMNPIINPGKSPWLYACTLLGFALVVATCVYLIFEKPATDWLRQKFFFSGRRRAASKRIANVGRLCFSGIGRNIFNHSTTRLQSRPWGVVLPQGSIFRLKEKISRVSALASALAERRFLSLPRRNGDDQIAHPLALDAHVTARRLDFDPPARGEAVGD
jgi:hypothetical protein